MSELKCPFCQQELVKDTPFAWNCPNEECVETDMMWGTANIWQELIRTRKALDKAKWWLHEIIENHRYTPISTAEMALKEITALEQKDK